MTTSHLSLNTSTENQTEIEAPELMLIEGQAYCTSLQVAEHFEKQHKWEAYQRLLPSDQHLITKRYTQSIERQTLNFRTRIKRLARKTSCFSKSIEIHDKVISEFINQTFFNSSKS